MKPRSIFLLALTLATVTAAEPLVLTHQGFAVSLDPSFPRVLGYRLPAGALPAAPAAGPAVVELNGKPAPCHIKLAKKAAGSAAYTLEFNTEKIAVELTATVAAGHLELRMSRVAERGPVKLKSLAFPNNPLIVISGAVPDAAIAACHATNTNDQFGATFREKISPLAALKPGDKDTGNYFFASGGGLAAGLGSNNFTDVNRCAWQVTAAEGVNTLTAQNPLWEIRKFDDERLPAELPWVRVFVTGDLNGDAKADWQDAAIAFRRGMPKPFGHETVKTLVGENIAMNFASGAQQPFLKILDEIKRIHLATDGLPNQVNIKGFSSEGHDSANTDYADHWNERAGGLRDLQFLLEKAPAYGCRVGFHINASEAYPEARRYRPEILRRNAQGGLAGGWVWLDHAHMLDKDKDVRSGQLFAALERMRADLPKLAFVYVDTYWEHGWCAAQTARKINSLGLPMYSEGDSCVDPWIVWGHWRGTKHTVQRFLWFSDRDLFANDPILRAGRADTDGFMGWQNQHSFHNFIQRTFSARLPAKYLQHFELMRWTPGESAEFSGGVKVVKSGNTVTVGRDGKTLMTWDGGGDNSNLFIPWPPQNPEKIYIWSDRGGDIARDLPPGWPASWLALYQLSDRGRSQLPAPAAVGGGVTLKVPAKTPLVLYPKAAPAQKPMAWGEGGRVVNPGFDSHDLTGWNGPADARVEADKNGNPRLVMPAAGTVSQTIAGLTPGRWYAATVWAQATGCTACAWVSDGKNATITPPGTKATWGPPVRHSAPNDARSGTNYQRLRVVFKATGPSTAIFLSGTLPTDFRKEAPGGTVEFDDVRVVETAVSPEADQHMFWEDFEHVESGGYGPFTCCPGERTHLSEANPPHTKDTIRGRFSLKSRDSGRVARTLPSSLLLKPGMKYRLSCQTLGQGRITVTSKDRVVAEFKFPNLPNNQAGPVTGEFVVAGEAAAPDAFLSLYRDGGDAIVIDDLAIDELRPATAEELAAASTPAAGPPIRDEKLPGHHVLLEETFAKPAGPEWKFTPSKLPGTSITARDGALSINAYAHISICAERPLPAGTAAVETRLSVDGEQGETWGPGLALLWPGGRQLRVNLRTPSGNFGIDSTAAPQKMAGRLQGGAATLRIRLEDAKVVCEARCADDAAWQPLAEFPRDRFPGAPDRVRLGKTHGVEALDDHTSPGDPATTTYTLLRVYQK